MTSASFGVTELEYKGKYVPSRKEHKSDNPVGNIFRKLFNLSPTKDVITKRHILHDIYDAVERLADYYPDLHLEPPFRKEEIATKSYGKLYRRWHNARRDYGFEIYEKEEGKPDSGRDTIQRKPHAVIKIHHEMPSDMVAPESKDFEYWQNEEVYVHINKGEHGERVVPIHAYRQVDTQHNQLIYESLGGDEHTTFATRAKGDYVRFANGYFNREETVWRELLHSAAEKGGVAFLLEGGKEIIINSAHKPLEAIEGREIMQLTAGQGYEDMVAKLQEVFAHNPLSIRAVELFSYEKSNTPRRELRLRESEQESYTQVMKDKFMQLSGGERMDHFAAFLDKEQHRLRNAEPAQGRG